MGEIFDIDYSPSADRIIALADNGVMVQCEIRFLDCRAERLSGIEQWQRPVAFTIWGNNGNLYILDAEAQNGQIWRYAPSGGSFSALPPQEYFSGAGRANLRAPVDLQIDSNGNVYILQADGAISKHRGSEQINFGYTSFPESQRLAAATSFFLDDTVTAQSIYVVSPNTRTIFETSLIGNFRGSFRTSDENLFTLVSHVAVVTNQNRQEIMYAVSGNTVFALIKQN